MNPRYILQKYKHSFDDYNYRHKNPPCKEQADFYSLLYNYFRFGRGFAGSKLIFAPLTRAYFNPS